MSEAPRHASEVLPIDEEAGVIRLFPRPVVWTAALVIVALGGFGLYQGIKGGMSGGGAGGGQSEPLTGDAVSAAAAAPIPSNTEWSTLNGPAMGQPAAPKAASSAPTTNTDDTDDSSADDSEAPPAASAAPTAVSAQPPAAQPAPTVDSSQVPTDQTP
jgi:hypothetical protein